MSNFWVFSHTRECLTCHMKIYMLPSNTTSMYVLLGSRVAGLAIAIAITLVDGREKYKLLEVSNCSITGPLTVPDAELLHGVMLSCCICKAGLPG